MIKTYEDYYRNARMTGQRMYPEPRGWQSLIPALTQKEMDDWLMLSDSEQRDIKQAHALQLAKQQAKSYAATQAYLLELDIKQQARRAKRYDEARLAYDAGDFGECLIILVNTIKTQRRPHPHDAGVPVHLHNMISNATNYLRECALQRYKGPR